jgi:CRP/FNR family transcriptional regulator, cyclic AMP receptor protein
MEDLSKILRTHAFLNELDEQHIKQIVGCASNVVFKENDYIFREGEEAKRFYLIRTGKVALEINGREKGRIRVLTLGPGQILGWSWIVLPYRWHFDAQVIENVRAISLDGECLRKKFDEDPKLGYEMMKRFTQILEQRLNVTRIQLMDMYKRG